MKPPTGLSAIVFFAWLSVGLVWSQAPGGNAARGAQLFKELRCSACHSVRGQGGSSAPELGARPGQPYTPAMLAGAIWSHVTKMWEAMERAGIARPQLSEQQVADIFAYLGGSSSGADKPGDATRGRELFEAKLCASCHDDPYQAPDLHSKTGRTGAFSLISGLWNHGGGMLSRMVSRNLAWQTLSPEEVNNILAYLNAGK